MKRYSEFLQCAVGLPGHIFAAKYENPTFEATKDGPFTITEVGEDYVVCAHKSGHSLVFPIGIFILDAVLTKTVP